MEGSPLAAFTTAWLPDERAYDPTVNAMVLEPPPPGTATAIPTLPLAEIRDAATVAVNSLPPTNLVGSGTPAHWTAAPAGNPLPSTTSVKPGPPTKAEPGLREVITGGWLIVNGSPAEETPAAVSETDIVACPAAVSKAAGTVVIMLVALILPGRTLVWVLDREITRRSVETKPVPVTVIVTPDAPTAAEFGLILVSTGWTIMRMELETVPSGFTTLRL
jgi:hypothetical protein